MKFPCNGTYFDWLDQYLLNEIELQVFRSSFDDVMHQLLVTKAHYRKLLDWETTGTPTPVDSDRDFEIDRLSQTYDFQLRKYRCYSRLKSLHM